MGQAQRLDPFAISVDRLKLVQDNLRGGFRGFVTDSVIHLPMLVLHLTLLP